MLCVEPKERKHFRPGARPGRIGDRGHREIVYVPNVSVPFWLLESHFLVLLFSHFEFWGGKRGSRRSAFSQGWGHTPRGFVLSDRAFPALSGSHTFKNPPSEKFSKNPFSCTVRPEKLPTQLLNLSNYQKIPRAHKNRIGTPPPRAPPKKIQNIPPLPKTRNFMGMERFPAERKQKFQVPHKIGAAFSSPRIAGPKKIYGHEDISEINFSQSC